MFDDWRQRHRRQRIFNKAKAQLEAEYKAKGKGGFDEFLELQHEIRPLELALSKLDSDQLVKKAQKYGIEIPLTTSWWWKVDKWRDDEDGREYDLPPEDVKYYLTDFGKINVKKLIRTERRNNFEWWARVIIPIIAAFTGLVGVITGLMAVLKK